MFTGGIAIPGACIGIFLGGYLLKRFQLRPSGAVGLVLFFNILCLCCYALLFFFGCDNVKMAGATEPYFSAHRYIDYKTTNEFPKFYSSQIQPYPFLKFSETKANHFRSI